MDFPLLSALIWLPVAAAVVVLTLPERRRELVTPVAFGASLIEAGLAGYLVATFPSGEAGFTLIESRQLVPALGVEYHLGVDGISLFLVALTTLLVPLCILASGKVERPRPFMAALLAMEFGLVGVFLALDLLLFFVFFEVILVPMYFLIGLWGGERRVYAAVKFFIYTAAGSALLLAAIVFLAAQSGDGLTFDFTRLRQLDLPIATQRWLFAGFGLAFAIKVPIFPFHTWLPDAHTEAPTAGSVLLAGVLLKIGTYGLLRFNLELFPQVAVDWGPVLAGLGVVGIVYGAAVALVQPDVKRLIAYSSVSHLGFVVLGIFAFTSSAMQGGVLQMVNHGLTTGALFLVVGMLYDRWHTREIAAYRGLQGVVPLLAGSFLFLALASAGLPGLSGFVGEFMVLIGSYPSRGWLAVVAAGGVVLAAAYLLWAYERMFTGEPSSDRREDLNATEAGILVPIVALVLFLGIYPKPVLDRIQPAADRILERLAEVPGFESSFKVEAP